jgi:transcriptional regulator with XRE-family HTH domain
MNWVKNIRETFGLTQTQLASFIEVSKSTLAMAETGKRLLPTAALLKLNMLEVHLQQPRKMAINKIVQHALQKHSSTLTKAINYKTKELAYQIAVHKNKVDAAERQHTQALQALVLVQAMTTAKQAEKINKKDAAWFRLLQMNAMRTLKNTHPMQQVQWQSKIDGLQQEAIALQTILETLG